MNKRWFALILILTLLPSCSGETNKTAPSEALYETKPTDPVGFSTFYDLPDPKEELWVEALDFQDAEGFCFWNQDILIFSGSDNTVLTLLSGDTRVPKATTVLSPATVPSLTVTADAITYIEETTRELVILNGALEEERRIPLPEGCSSAVLSSCGQLLYYCASDALRVLNLAEGTDRPLREMNSPIQGITALHCDDSIVQCSMLHSDGNCSTLFLSAETGKLLRETKEPVPLWTEGNLYFAIHQDGAYRELLSGFAGFDPSVLVTEDDPTEIIPVLSKQSVVLRAETDTGVMLNCYHLERGKHTAQITLPQEYQLRQIQPDPQRDALWLLCYDQSAGRNILCRWNLTMSDPDDPQRYLQPRWTLEDPDLTGLNRCRALAQQLSEQYGVQIRVWTDATPDCADFRFTAEHQVPLICRALEELEQALAAYPKGFLQELGQGKINICLVRSIHRADGFEQALPCLLYWDEGSNAHLILTSDESPAMQTHRFLSELIDNRVLALSKAYDGWESADPAVSAHQERSHILSLAMADGNEATFRDEWMQAKLRQLCVGIRNTFRSAKSEKVLPWEQYLPAP